MGHAVFPASTVGRSEMKIPDAGRRIRQIATGIGRTVRKQQNEADMRDIERYANAMPCNLMPCNLMAEVGRSNMK